MEKDNRLETKPKDKDGKGEDDLKNAQKVAFTELLRFAEPLDYLLLTVGAVLATVNGLAVPGFSLVFGKFLDELGGNQGVLIDQVNNLALFFVYIGLATFVCSWAEVSLMRVAATRQSSRIRQAYLSSLLRMEQGWFDTSPTVQLTASLAEDAVSIENGLGMKLGNAIHMLSTAVCGVGVGFITSWKLTLVILSTFPLIAFGGHLMGMASSNGEKLMSNAYARAGGIASESFAAVRTVASFGRQENVARRYVANLNEAKVAGVKKGLNMGIAMAITMSAMFFSYGIGLWYGARLIREHNEDHPECIADPSSGGCVTGGDVVLTFFSVLIGAFSIGQAAPNFGAFMKARVSGHKVFSVIDRKPLIDAYSKEGKVPREITGDIEFRDVTFAYPSRPKDNILTGFNLHVKAGETVALIGGSGCGKSTLLQLLQRMYDVNGGSVLVDGVDIKELNLANFRSRISVVSQEPVLFGTSILNNVAYGKPNGEPVTRLEIEEAVKSANADGFISKLADGDLSKGLETDVGERGGQMSGGQKQRIAIARAVIRQPRLLILDEATSALDSKSERIVQGALDRLMATGERRTTFIVAHRLSTITHADRIIVLDKGNIVETGSHAELMEKEDSVYKKMRKLQELEEGDEEDEAADMDGEEVKEADPDEVIAGAEVNVPGGRPRSRSRAPSASRGRASTSVSATEPAVKDKDAEEEAQRKKDMELPPVPFGRVWELQKGDIWFFVFGCFGAIVNGAIWPGFAIVFTEMTTLFYTEDQDKMERESMYYMLGFFGVAAATGCAWLAQTYCFSKMGENLTFKLRNLTFRALLRQEITFFDLPENSSGRLSTRLSTDAALVQATTGEKLGVTFQNMFSLLFGIVIAFTASWELTLVLLGTIPIMIASAWAETAFFTGEKIKDAFEDSGQVISESVSNIRTVKAFGLQQRLLGRFSSALDVAQKKAVKQGTIGGIAFAASQMMQFFIYAVCFWAGGMMINEGIITFNEMMTVFFAVTMAAYGAGQSASMATDAAKAEPAKRAIFSLLDSKSGIDPSSSEGLTTPITGHIEFRNVTFRYPSRPDQVILDNFSLVIPAGKTAAFVGPSGSGKSTLIQLVQRFYDPEDGMVVVDGHDVKEYNVNWLRRHFALVPQEPTLFGGTIEDNIKFGSVDFDPDFDLSTELPRRGDVDVDDKIKAATDDANATGFVSEFPKGYATQVGEGGSQLSGGQKQRVALARAVVRAAPIHCFDEATSALDSTSEKIVQAALERLMHDSKVSRTTMVVAHRLSTIQRSDMIAVIEDGSLVEVGTHSELLAKGGLYFRLAQAQGEPGTAAVSGEGEGGSGSGSKPSAPSTVEVKPSL